MNIVSRSKRSPRLQNIRNEIISKTERQVGLKGYSWKEYLLAPRHKTALGCLIMRASLIKFVYNY